MATSRGYRAPRNDKQTCRGVKDKAGKKFPRMSDIRGIHKRSAKGYGPFTASGGKNPKRCAEGEFSSTGKTFAYDRTKAGFAKYKKGCTVKSGKLVNIEASAFCISRKKSKTAKLRMRSCLNKDLKVTKPTATGKCRKGSNRGAVRFKAYNAAKRAAKKGAANRGRRAVSRSRR